MSLNLEKKLNIELVEIKEPNYKLPTQLVAFGRLNLTTQRGQADTAAISINEMRKNRRIL